MRKYLIMVRHELPSTRGAVVAPVRDPGGVVYFDSQEKAQAEADRLQRGVTIPGITYTPEAA